MPASEAPRRFYQTVDVAPGEEGAIIALDGRPARTRAKRPLALPTNALALLIAEEWRSQDEAIRYETMPATRLAHTTIDGVALDPDAAVDAIERYAASDLLCYRAEGPGALVRRQAETWDPLLRWVQAEMGLRFELTTGVVHHEQPPETLNRLRAMLKARSAFDLAGLSSAAAVFGSAILALALEAGVIGAEQAFAASRLDETFQEEQWGVDVGAAQAAEWLAAEAVMLERWFAALR